ncbi:MAG: chemotaxis protein CheW [Spirochaetaceae bacterium]|nr:MAG: chemotaxis protein CheW [Spirochaetaceae bacterium]
MKETFLSEAEDHTRVWEETLLELEKNPGDMELLGRLFRSIHTLKGCAGFVECEPLQALTHELESILQEVREDQVQLEASLIDALFDGLDLTKRLVSALAEDSGFDGDIGGLILRARSMRRIAEPQQNTSRPAAEQAIGSVQEQAAGPLPEQAAERQTRSGSRTCVLEVEILAEKREAYLRSLLIQSKLEEAGRIVEISPSLEDLRLSEAEFRFQMIIETDMTVEMLRKDIDIDQVNILSCELLGGPEDTQPLEELLPAAAEDSRRSEQSPRPGKIEEIVRVPVDKLDTMMNLVGELVVHNSGFISTLRTGKVAYGKSPMLLELEQKTESLARIARSLQDAVMKVRMLPVATIFSRFNRVIRDLAKHRGKEVELEIFGEETEIDKKVIDRIGEPLIHLLRNSVDHGIEDRSDRVAYGKDAKGHIQVGAYQEGDRICVEVKDDGQGLNRESIASKAVERGLISREAVAKMTDEDVFDFVFYSGFSTAKEVTDISGRGVGLDIVKRTVEEMGGSVRIQSTLGLGTSTTITLPLTMAIINALLVEDCGVNFAIPLSSVREVIQPRRSRLQRFDQNRVFRLREEVIAILELETVLGLRGAHKTSAVENDPEISIVVVDYGNRKIGLVVDELKGRDEIVIKSLTNNFEDIEGLVGASILGTGKIALILDVRSMLDSYYQDNEGEIAFARKLAAAQKQRRERESKKHELRQAEQRSGVKVAGNGLGEGDGEDNPSIQPPATKAITDLQPSESASETASDSSPGVPPAGVPPAGEPLLESEESSWGEAALSHFEEILIDGAVQASQAISELLKRDIRVGFPESKIVPIGDVAAALGGEEIPVGGIFVEIEGDIKGGTLMVLPESYMRQFGDLLLGREAGMTTEIGDEERSALKETGNILSASFVGAISDATGLDIRLRVPELGMDMCLAVIDAVLARFNQPGKHTLLIEADLYYAEAEQVVCHLLILLERDSLQRLMTEVADHSA